MSYTPQENVTQTGEINKGIISAQENYRLITEDKAKFDSMWRHILTEDISGTPNTLDYTDPQLIKFNNLLVIGNNINLDASSYLRMRFSPDGGSTFRSSGYSRMAYYGGSNNALTNDRNTSSNAIHLSVTGNTETEPMNFSAQIGGLGNQYETRLAYYQVHDYISNLRCGWGGGYYNTNERHNAFQILPVASQNFTSGKISIYGLATGF